MSGDENWDPLDEEEPFGVVVSTLRAETARKSLQEEGCYDGSREIVTGEDGTVVLPVSSPPSETPVREVVRQRAPRRSPRTLDEHLERQGWTDDDIERAPSSWAVLGSVILVTMPEDCPDETTVGEALLTLHGEADTVLAREGIDGPERDPHRRVVAGTGDTETVHTEHGTRYAMDLSSVMFSPGNEAERTRLGAAVARGADNPVPPETGEPPADPTAVGDAGDATGSLAPLERTDEQVFDMFAGIGYFTLPMARAGADVTAAEINPSTYRYLIENVALNEVTDRVQAYRADCREVADELTVDRVVMGHFDAHEYLDTAFGVVRHGGLVHYHEVTPTPELWDRPIDRLERAAANAGQTVDIVGRRRVKSFSEGVFHVVVDARVR